MAAAFALGAQAVQMGTRMVSAAESPVHRNWKDLIVRTPETGTIMLNRHHKPGFRVLATPVSEAMEQSSEQIFVGSPDAVDALYFRGDLDATFAFGGQVAGRIEAVRPVRDILYDTMWEFYATVEALGRLAPSTEGGP
jgi:enoyl-[acyl-carrier protein] reductase II